MSVLFSGPDELTASVYTLGCKLNQVESEAIADSFRQSGFSIAGSDADEDESAANNEAGPYLNACSVLIINTCTVTSKSEQKARRVIRKALRDPRDPVVIVTGCYAQVEKEALEALEEPQIAEKRLFVVPGAYKGILRQLPEFIATRKKSSAGPVAGDVRRFVAEWVGSLAFDNGSKKPAADPFCFAPGEFSFHSRAFLKIQDGCDNACAYCRTRLARGKSRSLEASKVLTALRALEEKGYAEAVLAGVNISQYRDDEADSKKGAGFAELLELLLEGTKTISLRLSSIEPEVFGPAFIRAISHERVRPHFHLSLQSASPSVLARMNRRYTPEEARECVSLLCSAKPAPFLGCDVITGFPGETPEDFAQTLEFCAQAGFAGIHAFPFSRRPGTAAWSFGGRVPEHEAGARARALIALAAQNRSAYIARQKGRGVSAVVEDAAIDTEGFCAALSENYLRLLIPCGDGETPRPGAALHCKITDAVQKPGSRFDAFAVMI